MKTQKLVSVTELIQIVRNRPGITTPELADILGCSVTMARWYVNEAGYRNLGGSLEFYEGNRIRVTSCKKATL